MLTLFLLNKNGPNEYLKRIWATLNLAQVKNGMNSINSDITSQAITWMEDE
jgi:hypothetical protein